MNNHMLIFICEGKHLKTAEEVQQFKEKCQRHNDFVVTERCAMAERQQLGVSCPDSYLHVSIDGSAGNAVTMH